MYDNFALLLRPLGLAIGRALGRLSLLRVALVEQSCYAEAECLSLRPAAICEGRIVGRWGGQMPCLICSVETSTVSWERVSLLEHGGGVESSITLR